MTVPVCPAQDRVLFGPVSAAMFGPGLLAVGCPGSGYRGGLLHVFAETLRAGADPLFTVSDVSGWSVTGLMGGPAYPDARDVGIVAVASNGEVSSVTEYTGGSSSWWGSSPVTWTVGECSYLAVGEPTAKN